MNENRQLSDEPPGLDHLNPYQAPATSPPADEVPARADEPEIVTCFRSARPWGVAACLGIWLQVMLAVVAAGLQLALLWLYDVDSVEEIDSAIEQGILYWMNVTFISMFAMRLLTAVPFLAWTYRSYSNLPALGHPSPDWKPSVAAFCWLVPFFNLLAPCLVMRELRWRSDPRAEVVGKANPGLQYVNLWWGAWIGAILMTAISNGLSTAATTLADHVQALRFNMATDAVLIVCGALAVWLVLSIDRLQLRRHAALIAQPT